MRHTRILHHSSRPGTRHHSRSARSADKWALTAHGGELLGIIHHLLAWLTWHHTWLHVRILIWWWGAVIEVWRNLASIGEAIAGGVHGKWLEFIIGRLGALVAIALERGEGREGVINKAQAGESGSAIGRRGWLLLVVLMRRRRQYRASKRRRWEGYAKESNGGLVWLGLRQTGV
jgi:hypothetical protein